MAGATDSTVELDRSGPVWTGRCSGLGEVRIDADGTLTVHPETDDPRAAAALRHGWGELLALAHRGVQLLHGTALAADEDAPALLLTGATSQVASLTASLVRSGWLVVSDQLTPADLGGDDIVVTPRPGPVLMPATPTPTSAGEDGPQVPEAEGSGTTVRDDSDVVVAEYPTSTRTHRLGAIVEAARHRVGEAPDQVLVGLERFRLASSLHVLGALRPNRDSGSDHPDASGPPPEPPGGGPTTASGVEEAPGSLLIGEHLRLAAIPALRVRVNRDQQAEAVRRITTWFADTTTS